MSCETSPAMAYSGAFTYAPLPINGRHVRLLHLLPDLTENGLLQCTLQTKSLDYDHLVYETLSYCWGPTPNPVEIRCDGYGFKVTATLHEALRQLRPAKEARLLWIDQISIDQSNDEEKAHQVAMMRDIYQRSQRTVAWLGPRSTESDIAIKALHRISLAAATSKDSFPAREAQGDLNEFRKLVSEKHDWGDAQATTKEMSAISTLLNAPWFTRVWMIQEASVSQMVQMTSGPIEIDFDILFFGILAAARAQMQTGPMNMRGLQNLTLFARLRNASSQGKTLPLPVLLEHTRQFAATDPRDKFYALYGLTSTDINAIGLYPDYKRSVRELYIQTTAVLSKESGNLHLLELAGSSSQNAELPSWVPTFHASARYVVSFTYRGPESHEILGRHTARAVLMKLFEAQGKDLAEINDEMINEPLHETGEELTWIPSYAASKGSKLETLEMSSTGSLKLFGQIVDTVTEIGDVLVSPIVDPGVLGEMLGQASTVFQVLKTVISWFRVLLRNIRNYGRVISERERMILRRQASRYPTGESMMTVYWKTICGNHLAMSEAETETTFQKWRKAFRSVRLVSRIRSMLHLTNTTGFATWIALMWGRGSGWKDVSVFATMAEMSYERRTAWTKNGYLALLPAEAQEGDAVALLHGGRLPFLLRCRGARWQLIGPCYVHGIMDGEAFDESASSNISLI